MFGFYCFKNERTKIRGMGCRILEGDEEINNSCGRSSRRRHNGMSNNGSSLGGCNGGGGEGVVGIELTPLHGTSVVVSTDVVPATATTTTTPSMTSLTSGGDVRDEVVMDHFPPLMSSSHPYMDDGEGGVMTMDHHGVIMHHLDPNNPHHHQLLLQDSQQHLQRTALFCLIFLRFHACFFGF